MNTVEQMACQGVPADSREAGSRRPQGLGSLGFSRTLRMHAAKRQASVPRSTTILVRESRARRSKVDSACHQESTRLDSQGCSCWTRLEALSRSLTG